MDFSLKSRCGGAVEYGSVCGKSEKRNIRIKQYLNYKDAAHMRVKVHYLGLVKTYTNKGQDDLELSEGAKLSDLLSKLAANFGKPFDAEIYEPAKREVKAMFTVMVNGVIMGQLDGVETKLKDGDNVIIMPLMTGG